MAFSCHFDRKFIGSQNLQAKFCSKDFRQENQQANKQIIKQGRYR
jgi:hypothetical protein